MSRKKYSKAIGQTEAQKQPSVKIGFKPLAADDISTASREGVEGHGRRSRTDGRINSSAVLEEAGKFTQIQNAIMPFDVNGTSLSKSCIDIKGAVDITNKAYASVGIVRNTIDTMAEMANEDIFLDGGSKKAQDFFKEWFKIIGLDNIKEQYFRERFKSGNVFIYSFDGIYEQGKKLPMKYVLLNPYHIVAPFSYGFGRTEYSKILSQFEIKQIGNRKTKEAQRIYLSLPETTRIAIDNAINGTSPIMKEIEMPISPKNLSMSFYKKQDYEPFAIPMVWPALRDVNMKLEMKALDAAVMRSIENVILLITMGDDKGDYDPENLEAMRGLLQHPSVGRAIVSDYTTKGEWLVPDLGKFLGKEKYETLNQDIKDSLMSILGLEGTYSGLSMKIKIFINKILEDRQRFLDDFLIPQMERVAKVKGFRTIPTPKFREIDFEKEADRQRIGIRLCEIGAITPKQLYEFFETGSYPHVEDLDAAQEEYVKERREGKWNPPVAGTPMIPSAAEEERIELQKKSLELQEKEAKNNESSNDSPEVSSQLDDDDEKVQTPQSPGRPAGSGSSTAEKYSKILENDLVSVFSHYNICEKALLNFFREEKGVEELSDVDKKNIKHILLSVSSAKPQQDWLSVAVDCVKDPRKIREIGFIDEIDDIMKMFDIDQWGSMMIYHSKNS